MKLIVDIPEEVKQEFDKTESIALKGAYFDLDGIIGKAIQNGIPLDDVKAEFKSSYPTNYMGEPELNGAACHFSLNKVFEILDNIGKGDSE